MPGTPEGFRKRTENMRRNYGHDIFSKMAKKAKGTKRPGAGFDSARVGPDGLTGPERAEMNGYKYGFKSLAEIKKNKQEKPEEVSREKINKNRKRLRDAWRD
jgi:hypothetical protein